jgi:hypothetical protein
MTIILSHRAESDSENHNNTMLCLAIPVPCCVQKLLREPPVCYSREKAIKVLNIKDLGKEFGRSRDEIVHACNLASGPSDLVV